MVYIYIYLDNQNMEQHLSGAGGLICYSAIFNTRLVRPLASYLIVGLDCMIYGFVGFRV